MSKRSEKLQNAIGMVSDEFVAEAHADDATAGEVRASLGSPAAGQGPAGQGDSVGTRTCASAEQAVHASAISADPDDRAGRSESESSPSKAAEAAFAEADAKAGERKPAAKRTPLRTRVLAIAACLAVVAGIGALAFSGLQPSADAPFEKLESNSDVVVLDADGDAEEYITDTTAFIADAGGEVRASGVDGALEMKAMSADAAAVAEAGSIAVGTGTLEPPEPQAEAGLLTAAEWNDNENWPFFANLVNAGTVTFPSFGIDPRNRVKATVEDGAGNALHGEKVVLLDADGDELWHATSDKAGHAYLFFRDGDAPASVSAPSAGATEPVAVEDASGQGAPVTRLADDVTLKLSGATAHAGGDVQVMFIVDTTGSMSDEIAYLQADFASIAADAGADSIAYSANFYRDIGENEEYVTKCNDFTGDIATVQDQLDDEYATGGGDEPEAVAQILAETITGNGQWRDDVGKVAFLVFDAPPHEGADDAIDAAVRSAAARGIRVVPVVASNASRDTELFGRALAICTGAPYVFLTDDSGIGDAHLEPIVGDYTVEPLHDIIVRIIQDLR